MTNPVNMSVSPTDGQCLIEDGKVFATMQSSPMWSVADIDSYEEVCDDGGQCLVAGSAAVGVAVLGRVMDMFAREARGLKDAERLADAADAYKALGERAETTDAYQELGERAETTETTRSELPKSFIVFYYSEAGRLYRITGQSVKSARAYSSAARVAMKAGLDTAFGLAGLAADAYLEASKNGTREAILLRLNKATALLQMQAKILRDSRATGETSGASYQLEIEIGKKQIGALEQQTRLMISPRDNTKVYSVVKTELADVYERMGDAHVELGELSQAAEVYAKQRSASHRSVFTWRTVNNDERRWGRVKSAIVHLARDHDGRMEETARKLAEIFGGREGEFTVLLNDGRSWLNRLLRVHLKEEFIPAFRNRARTAFGARTK